MNISMSRRGLLLATAAVPLAAVLPGTAQAASTPGPRQRLRALESRFSTRIGVAAHDTGTGRFLGYRAGERFALCSTFKAVAAAGILRQAREKDPGLLDQVVRYSADYVALSSGGADKVADFSPETAQHIGTGMTVDALCSAAVSQSDNTAGNLLLERLGGTRAFNAFVRTLGDHCTRLDRTEPELNSNIAGDPRDTTTPEAMARTLHALTLGTALAAPDRDRLNRWLMASTTGVKRIRAGLPPAWRVGDKTGWSENGVINDVAVVWPTKGAPLIISIFTTRTDGTPGDNLVVKETAEIVVEALGLA
ncbi:class A beta-lactamase [Streptomyces cinnamoneus]|uniref:class A beta-lactamase n=1 Tax=Streptomyces cinnamoneus TaxID=53446 RepID=UPI0033E43DD9